MRAVIEHNLMNTDPALRVYAIGPMFRRERPQKGRYRQFHQVDVEAFGFTSPTIDVEMIELALALPRRLRPREARAGAELRRRRELPSGLRRAAAAGAARQSRRRCARTASAAPRRTRCACSTARCPQDQAVIDALPKIADHLCAPCREHFAEVRRQLELLGIPYRLSHRLVRGLDYYMRTTFEVTSDALGAQSSVLGGGRYDGLVKELGGPDLAGIGFALGLERLVMLVPAREPEPRCDVFLMPLAAGGARPGAAAAAALREAGLRVLLDPEGRSFKSRMKQADKLGARYVAILGDDELAKGVWTRAGHGALGAARRERRAKS